MLSKDIFNKVSYLTRYLCTLAVLALISAAGTANATVEISEYLIPTPDSSPQNIDVDKNGKVWFTELDGYNIGKFNPNTEEFTEYPTTYRPRDIVYNTVKKKINFTGDEGGNGHYGVVYPYKGSVVEIATGLPSGSAAYGTADPNGNFWFNGWDSQTVSKADMRGRIVNYLPPTFGYMSGLAEDPEGNLWLTIVNAFEMNPRLLKLDTQLAEPNTSQGFSEISIPLSQATIRHPVAALGKIWFAIHDLSQLASYDPTTDQFEQYPTPTPDAGIANIAIDRWGRIWFTEPTANQIGMLDLRTGEISEFPLPTPNSEPNGIAIDQLKDIVWFTESSANKIGKLVYR